MLAAKYDMEVEVQDLWDKPTNDYFDLSPTPHDETLTQHYLGYQEQETRYMRGLR